MVKVLSISDTRKECVYGRFLQNMADGSSRSEAIKEVAIHFQVCVGTVYNIIRKKNIEIETLGGYGEEEAIKILKRNQR